MQIPRVLKSRKILVASVGVASVTYACSQGGIPPASSGNLVPPPTVDGAPDGKEPPPTSGNLVPPPALDASPPPTSGNLVPPPPQDASPPPTSGNLVPPPKM